MYGEEPVGLNEFFSSKPNSENNLFELYPNPAKSAFTVLVQDELKSESVKIEVMDVSGKLIYSERVNQQKLKIPTEHLARGFYFVRLKSSNKQQIKKLIIEP